MADSPDVDKAKSHGATHPGPGWSTPPHRPSTFGSPPPRGPFLSPPAPPSFGSPIQGNLQQPGIGASPPSASSGPFTPQPFANGAAAAPHFGSPSHNGPHFHPPPPPDFTTPPPPPTFSQGGGSVSVAYAPPQPPTFSSPSKPDVQAVIPGPFQQRLEIQAETAKQQQAISSASEYHDHYLSEMIALDPYSVPTLPLPSEPPRRPNYFDGGSEGLGPAIYASDLLQDDMEGAETSAPYVAFSASTVMNQKKVANVASLGFGAVITPVRETNPRPPLVQINPVRCEFCGAYANLYCQLVPQSGEWKCALCGEGNDSKGEYLLTQGEDYSSWPELSNRVVDYQDLQKMYSSASDTALAVPVVLVIDETLDAVYLEDLKVSLLKVLESLPSATRIGIISYGRTVAVYDFNQSGVAAADVFPGTSSLAPESTKQLLYGSGVYLAPLHACLPVAQGVLSSLRPYRGDIPELERKRCLGVAVEVALALVRGPATDLPRSPMKRTGGSSRVVVCAGGPTTLGPGSVPHPEGHANFAYEERRAVKHMEQLGKEARRLEAAVDILCGGTCPIRVPVVHALAKASGGVLVIHDDFRETFAANVRGAINRVSGVRGTFEVRTSATVAVTRVIGPAVAAKEPPGEPAFVKDTATSLEMLSVEEGQGLALSMELTEDVPQDFVYFQFATRYTSLSQTAMTRVITMRLPTTGSTTTYLQSVDEEVATVLVGKRTALAAAGPDDLPDVRLSVDERAKDIALKLGKSVPKSRLHRFPNELPRLAESLFHLRRGPLLGGILGHEDERAVLRSLFLRADLLLSLRMVVPQLLLFRPGVGLQEIPPYALALHSENALVLDHGTDIFTWMGADLAADPVRSAAAEAACIAVVEEISQNRFPAPRVLSFREGSSQARYLMARLLPAHKDTHSEQETRFPPLRELQLDERAQLRAKLLPTDEPSFCEWMRSLRLVPPDPSSTR